MSKIGEQGYRAAQESPCASEMDASILGGPDAEDAELVSEHSFVLNYDDAS
jgi:hypothetical protein